MTDALAELREIAGIADTRQRVQAAGRFVNQYTTAELAARDLRDAHAFAYLNHPGTEPKQYGFNKATYEACGMAHMTWNRIRKLWEASISGDSPAGEGRYLRRFDRELPVVAQHVDPDLHLWAIRENHEAQANAHRIVAEGRKVRDTGLVELLATESSNQALAELAGVDDHTVYLLRARARSSASGRKKVMRGKPGRPKREKAS